MNRRTFLYQAAIGTFGFSFFSGIPFRFSPLGFSASLESFFLSIGAQGVENHSALEEICAKESMAWRQTGYKPLDGKYYLCQKGQKAIYLLHLPHKETGSLDVSALVLQEDVSLESWSLVASLSGFQLEALVKAETALRATNHQDRLASLLLPALPAFRPAKRTPGRFLTELGEVGVSAALGKDKTMRVKAAVYEAGETLWSSEYTSQYLQSL